MAQVTIPVGSRRYDLSCREGEQDRLLALGAMVDAKAGEAARAVGEANEVRQLLMASLLLADELSELRASEPDRVADAAARTLDILAHRLESIAQRLENERGAP